MKRARSRSAWAVLALVVAWLAATAWMRPLMLPDEGRYASVAWQMLQSGDWLTPTLNGLPFFHKPPLFYWITGAALAAFGPVEIAARMASITGGVLGAMALYLFTRRWSGEATARRALAVLLVQPLCFLGAQFANLDMLVAGCIVATVLALAHAALCFEAGQPHRAALWGAYVLAALGVLAKGLIGFVLPAAIIGLWLLLRGRWRVLLALFSLVGAVLFLAVAAPWFWAMQQRFDGFMHYFFVVQHFQRFAETGFNNVQPFWFYPAVLALCSLPCLLGVRFARGYFKDPVRLLMALAVGVVVLFFSLPQSKLVGYVLPAVPPLAWLMADASRARGRWWTAALAVSALLGLAVVAGLTVDQRRSARPLGLALRAQHQAGEPVFMVREYLYDVPFYARLADPLYVVDDWGDPRIARRDNWQKELADAGAFDAARARQLLVTPAALPQALCSAPVAWVMGASSLPQDFPVLAQAEVVGTAAYGQTLWRVRCGTKPHADTAP
ncbi:MAG: glycosyltransferase family 39 protein [Acidovorax sp.]